MHADKSNNIEGKMLNLILYNKNSIQKMNKVKGLFCKYISEQIYNQQ